MRASEGKLYFGLPTVAPRRGGGVVPDNLCKEQNRWTWSFGWTLNILQTVVSPDLTHAAVSACMFHDDVVEKELMVKPHG